MRRLQVKLHTTLYNYKNQNDKVSIRLLVASRDYCSLNGSKKNVA